MFLVIDNAPIYRNGRLDDICYAIGIELVKLPPYSPDFNPIELSFSSLKLWIRRNYREAECFNTFGHFIDYAIN